MNESYEKICVLGMGFIGLTFAATLAESGFEVLGVDILPEVVKVLQKNECYFVEPGLCNLINQFGGKNLNFSRHIADDSCGYYVICVGTPIDPVTVRPNLQYVEDATLSIVPHLKKGDTVILRSTVPLGTSRNVVIAALERETRLKAGEDFHFAYVPERTVEGMALYEQKHIPQIIGGFNQDSAEKASIIFHSFNSRLIYVPGIEEAELCKIIDNTYRDVLFAYSNQMAMISEKLGLDFAIIRDACNQDYPRNNVPMPSPGVGGPCLTKDPYILIDLSRQLNVDTQLIRAAREVNQKIVVQLANKILKRLAELGKELPVAKIFLMGVAFKGQPETSDIRSSTTVDLIHQLRPHCNNLYVFDSVTLDKDLAQLDVTRCSIEEGFNSADAVVIMNAHKSHRDLNILQFARNSRKPLLFVDCWRLYQKEQIQKDPGIIYSSVGLY
jgi:UDP-N-acetyl-D-mannosaminuronic acid dehydrogenase